MTMIAVAVNLTVRGPELSEHFEHVTDCFAELEAAHENLLDCSWEFDNRGDHAHVHVDITVEAETPEAAWDTAFASIRSAIHKAGGFTPNWGERVPGSAVVYRQDDAEVESISA